MLKSTRHDKAADYLGADLTDATARVPRPVDVCGLTPAGGKFEVLFWTWEWSEQGFESVVAELKLARCTFIDGPQGLASEGRSMRACDRVTGAAAKIPAQRSEIRGPYAGFVLSSLRLFERLHIEGVSISTPGAVGGVWEVYPANLWSGLVPGLRKKSTPAGVAQRRRILERLGLEFNGPSLNHDQLDAAVAALAAAASEGKVPGVSVAARGDPLAIRATGVLEEGPMVVVKISNRLRRELAGLAEALAGAEVPLKGTRRGDPGRAVQISCPLAGCVHVLKGGRGGWDAHVASRKTHPDWMPGERDGQRRKEPFRRLYPAFFLD